MTVYFVTSLHRSGSSMMMHCLEAGGMAARYGHNQDFLNVLYGRAGYEPNPGGFYALDDRREFNRADFAAEYQGILVKISMVQLLQLVAGDYKVIFMQRAPAEILASMAEFMPYQMFVYESAIWFYDQIAPALVKRLKKRGMAVTAVRYADVIADPLATFTALAAVGWPVDPAKAAAAVDAAQYRAVGYG